MIEVVDMLCLFAFHGMVMGRSSIRGDSGHPCSVSNRE